MVKSYRLSPAAYLILPNWFYLITLQFVNIGFLKQHYVT